MKCDELTPIELECNMGKDINGVVHREPWKAYDIDEVDAAIAELKSENKMLKERIANGDVSRITWIDEATELKAENESLKAKLENAYSTVAFNHLDAVMRERSLKRALWLARAERADDRARIFYFSDLESVLDIDGFSYDSKKKKGCKKLTARLWRIIWLEVERKCRAKAEEYR